MSFNTKIEWCHHTANLWHGCTKVHEGCDHCYAETLSHRWGRDIWGNDKPRMEIKSVWADLRKYQRLAAEAGEIHRVFVGSMMDIFEKPMPVINSKGELISGLDTGVLRSLLFDDIDDGHYPNLLFLFLTKRPSNINKYIPESWKENPPANVMFGTSPANQATADKLIPQLLQVEGKRFLSIEPMLGPINFSEVPVGKPGFDYRMDGGIHWVICGGESGHGARPMHPDWVRSIRDQCKAVGVPFLFKQWGEWSPGHSDDFYPENKPLMCIKQSGQTSWIAGDADTTINHSINYEESDHPIERVGKKAAGRMLDGKYHDEFPNQDKIIITD